PLSVESKRLTRRKTRCPNTVMSNWRAGLPVNASRSSVRFTRRYGHKVQPWQWQPRASAGGTVSAIRVAGRESGRVHCPGDRSGRYIAHIGFGADKGVPFPLELGVDESLLAFLLLVASRRCNRARMNDCVSSQCRATS